LQQLDITTSRVLRLDKAGLPLGWLSWEEAAVLWVKNQVIWHLGSGYGVLRGGVNRMGRRSCLKLPSIIATDGQVRPENHKIASLTNRMLFRRDRNMCLYCGRLFAESQLTRDHIIAKSIGGDDWWTNLATACRRCNQRKGAQSLEQAKMTLLAVPFVPNPNEYMVLANRHILADQMAFLQTGFSKLAM